MLFRSYAPDFKQFVADMNLEKDGLIDGDQRLIIPFYNEEKELVAFQGRALGESKMRYITVKVIPDVPKLYGADKVNKDESIYVLEGPIDSMFLENAVATADSNLETITKAIDKSKVVLVFDNEPRNKEICEKIDRAIENHFHVVIWPEMVESKDRKSTRLNSSH